MPPSIFSSDSTSPSFEGCVGSPQPGERPMTATTTSIVGGSSTTKDKDLELIRRALPTSTAAERLRFLSSCNGNTILAIEKLRNYLEWRTRYCGSDDSDFNSIDTWTYATRRARQQLSVTNKIGRDVDIKSDNRSTMTELPCTLFMLEHEPKTTVNATTNKKYYLQHLPARIDTTLASTSTYTLSLAIFLERILDRRTTDKITLIIDVRPGHNWANTKAIHLLPFIQSTVKLLSDLHPLRLEQCVIFPLPKMANMIWKVVTPFMGKDAVDKVCVVSGPAGSHDGVPKKISEHLDNDLIRKLEATRLSCLSKLK